MLELNNSSCKSYDTRQNRNSYLKTRFTKEEECNPSHVAMNRELEGMHHEEAATDYQKIYSRAKRLTLGIAAVVGKVWN
ncbi:hypothetical protein PIB30_054349 [Stylosanthes scabra]|uniref:Uncharacterized protein n=1 Tax=Stylosanthes scabra TaxID=79078 RepID=A0ABU6YHJ5_9FABA|nr:hypothetical protein [Stylosanthes scabra]